MNKGKSTNHNLKRCQFRTMLSVGNARHIITTCKKPALWDVFDKAGKEVGHVCGDHALAATHGGFKIG